jgi:hypothetical protein
MPGVSGVTVVTNARAFYTTRAAAGASGARHSLRPLFSEGRTISSNLAQTCCEIVKLCLQMMLFEIDSGGQKAPLRRTHHPSAVSSKMVDTLSSFALPPSLFLLRSSSFALPPSLFLLRSSSFALPPSLFLLRSSSFALPPSLFELRRTGRATADAFCPPCALRGDAYETAPHTLAPTLLPSLGQKLPREGAFFAANQSLHLGSAILGL